MWKKITLLLILLSSVCMGQVNESFGDLVPFEHIYRRLDDRCPWYNRWFRCAERVYVMWTGMDSGRQCLIIAGVDHFPPLFKEWGEHECAGVWKCDLLYEDFNNWYKNE